MTRQYWLAHRDKIVRNNRRYKRKNKMRLRRKARKYYWEHRKEVLRKARIWRNKNKKKVAKRNKKYQSKNKKKIRIKQLKYEAERRKIDVQFKLAKNLRNRLQHALKRNKKVGSAVKDLGCTLGFLKRFLEKQFYGNMTWDNYGTIWHIDHIIPLTKFDLTDRKQLLKAINYKNLQPLLVKDHRKKTIAERYGNQ
jgi:hypothetical protein